MAVVLGFALLIGAAYVGYWYGTKSAKRVPGEEAPRPEADRPLDETTETTPPPTPTPRPQPAEEKILFLRHGDIWLINSDGSEEELLVKGPLSGSIGAAVRANEDLVSHFDCEGLSGREPCALNNTQISTKETAEVAKFERQSSGFGWSSNLDYVAYIHIAEDGSSLLRVYDAKRKKETFAKILGMRMGRGGSYNDSFYASFSPDNSKVLAVDTSLDTPTSIFVFDLLGNPLAAIGDGFEDMVGGSATFPLWDSNNSLIYKQAGGDNPKILRYNLLTKESGVVLSSTEANGYGLKISPNKKNLVFWTADGGFGRSTTSSLWSLNLQTKSLNKLASNMIAPVWISNSQVVGVKSRPCSGTECDTPTFGMVEESLNLVSIDGKETNLTGNPGYPIPQR